MQVLQISAPAEPLAEPLQLDILKILRIFLYIYVFIKVLEILLMQKRRLSPKERVIKRFNFAHESIMGLLTGEELLELENTFKNTVANIQIKPDAHPRVKKGNRSRLVTISETLNVYYDHVEMEDKDTEQTEGFNDNEVAEPLKEQVRVDKTKEDGAVETNRESKGEEAQQGSGEEPKDPAVSPGEVVEPLQNKEESENKEAPAPKQQSLITNIYSVDEAD